jgi:alkylhydroperoxidase/carboxymuconolactone decarboxylase family protein YurZ
MKKATRRRNEGLTVSVLDGPTRALVRVAAAVADTPEEALIQVMREAIREGTPPAWLDELVLAAVLFAGFPRGLVAAHGLRRVVPAPTDAGDAADYAAWPAWQERGEATCRIIYGDHYERLRDNVRRLHPALDAWIVTDGYGRTLSRPALDLVRREFCSIALLVPQLAPRQLHLRGALNAGATIEQVDDVLRVVAACSTVPDPRLRAAEALWAEIRSSRT